MLSRKDILERLLEPYVTLSAEEIARAEELAKEDSEVARALSECRGMSVLSAKSVFGESSVSDAAFLVGVRERIEKSAKPSLVRGIFGTTRRFALAATACVAIMAVVIGYGTWWGGDTQQLLNGEAIQFASALESVDFVDVDSLAAVSISPESLAVYLGIPDMAENWDFNEDSDIPISDELLGLDQQSLEEVMNGLETTEFF